MKINNLILGLLTFLIGTASIFAQPKSIKFQSISVGDGLSHNIVYGIFQDRKGFMWFSTQDGGLNKYDGYKFKIYRNEPGDKNSISSNNVNQIIEDYDGNLWIGSWGGGLNKFDPKKEKFTSFKHNPQDKNSLSDNKIQSLHIDGNGIIWIGTTSGGLNSYNSEANKFTHYINDPGDPTSLGNNRVWAICNVGHQEKDKLWIATENGLDLFFIKNEQFIHYEYDIQNFDGLSFPQIRSLLLDKSETLWVGTAQGLDRFNPASQTFTHFIPYPEHSINSQANNVNTIFEDREGTIWIGTQMGGLSSLNCITGVFTHFVHDPNNLLSISYNDVRDIYQDRSGIIWIATRGGGLNNFDSRPFKFNVIQKKPDKLNSMSGNRVKAIFVDSKNLIWIGLDDNGLNKYDRKNNKFTHYKHDPDDPGSIGSNRIKSIYEDSDSIIWVGTDDGGLNKLDEKTGKFSQYIPNPQNPAGISSDDVMSIIEDKDGILWIGTKNGLNKFYKEKEFFEHYKNNPDDPTSISSNRIMTICIDKTNFLWIGTDNGLNKFDPQTNTFKRFFKKADNANSLSSNRIFTIHEDNSGVLWFGTTNGLNCFNPQSGKFNYFTLEDGLSSAIIYGIVEDEDRKLWLSTINGLARFSMDSKIVRNYDISDGLQGNEFSPGVCFKSNKGELFFGGTEGLNFFYPDSVLDDPSAPSTVITDFQIFNAPVPIGENSILKKHINFTDEIVLSNSDYVFTFEFAALHYLYPEKNCYKYMLQGFDNAWIDFGTKRFVMYNNLPAGEYVFKVKGANSDGVWDETGASIKLVITPAFWETWWFYSIVIFALITSVYAYIKNRERNLQITKQILAETVKERTLEIMLQKQKITDSIQFASRIQSSLLPTKIKFERIFPNHFILYRPRDIVSGDFYWLTEKDDKIIIAAADCTGHGVPAAMLSMLGISFLNEIVNKLEIKHANEILNKLRQSFIESPNTKGDELDIFAGMSISLCVIDIKAKQLEFSGAYQPLYLLRKLIGPPTQISSHENDIVLTENGEYQLFEIKANKMPIGNYIIDKSFTNKEIQLRQGDTIYLFSDGYTDQFGEPLGKKFLSKRFKNEILRIQDKKMNEQLESLNKTHDKWRGNLDQLDDILVIGIRF
jgi:ligand-binding sensor domain-containing protein/serine phosphatase RsbU (regulator of sigma subunit)